MPSATSGRRSDRQENIELTTLARKLLDMWLDATPKRYDPPSKHSKYMPHQGPRECARRVRQGLASGL